MNELSKKHSQILMAVLTALIALYAFMMLIDPIGGKKPNMAIFSFHAFPAALCLFFAWRNNYRGFIWTNYISMMLFCVAASNIFVGYGWVVYAEVALTSCAFLVSLIAAMLYKKRAKQQL